MLTYQHSFTTWQATVRKTVFLTVERRTESMVYDRYALLMPRLAAQLAIRRPCMAVQKMVTPAEAGTT
jgi:hypothetical protein